MSVRREGHGGEPAATGDARLEREPDGRLAAGAERGDGGTSGRAGGASGATRSETRERVFRELRERVARRLPGWTRRGPEDPAWVLLEVFAEALAELREEAETLEERVFPRVLESLGDEPRWAQPARGAVVFVPRGEGVAPIAIARGTVVSTRRRADGAHAVFETTSDAFASAARLQRVVAVSAERLEELVPYPQRGWESGGGVSLFGECVEVARHAYLGDPLLSLLRGAAGEVVLEWPGAPAALAAGRWEYSAAGGGWRPAQVELEEGRAASGRRFLRARVRGPLVGLGAARIEGTNAPWLRVALPRAWRGTLRLPSWVAAGFARGGAPGEHGEHGEHGAAVAGGSEFVLSFPRPVARVLSFGGEQWEDHSFSTGRFEPAASSAAWDSAIYLGWDRAASASVYWEVAGGGGDPRFVWEHSTGHDFRALAVEDGTGGFRESGSITWTAPPGWESRELHGERFHWLRARWVGGAYAKPPRVRAVLPHAAAVRQGRTLESHVTRVRLDRSGRGALDLALPEGEPERFEAVELRVEGRAWERPPRARIRRLPAGGHWLDVGTALSGEVTVKVSGLRAGLGGAGNLAPGALQVLEGELSGALGVEQPLSTSGGSDPESEEEFRARIRREWKAGDRAVTERDYRVLASTFAPEIARVEVRRDPGSPSRVVVTAVTSGPGGGDRELPGALAPARARDLEALLAARAPVGTRVDVVPPLYFPVAVAARRAGGHADEASPPESVRRAIEERLRLFFHPLRGGADGSGFPASESWDAEGLRVAAREALVRSAEGGAPGAGFPGWEPRGWRYDVALTQPASGPQAPGLPPRGPPDGTIQFPVLERFTFELPEGPSLQG